MGYKILSKNIFLSSWPMIKKLAEENDYSVSLAKKKVCDLFSIPYAQDDGFQRIKEYKEWRDAHMKMKSGERRWIK